MNDILTCQSVAAYRTAEITEKKSRFIGEIFPVRTEEEAEAAIASVVKKYHDARHHCFAYVLGERGDFLRASDDGEPQGTAGRPILSVLTGAGLTDTLIVVTRYFGGTLLGTGGLTRAYTQAAQEVLKDAEIRTAVFGQEVTFRVSYALSSTVEHYLRTHDLAAFTPVYEEDVRYGIFVPSAHVSRVIDDLTNICSGNIDISAGDPHFR